MLLALPLISCVGWVKPPKQKWFYFKYRQEGNDLGYIFKFNSLENLKKDRIISITEEQYSNCSLKERTLGNGHYYKGHPIVRIFL